MPDELRPDDIPNLWREEPREPVRISADEVRRKAQQFEARLRRAFRIVAVMMILSAMCYGLLLYFFPGILQRIGCTLTLAAYLYCFRKRGALKRILAEAPAATCAAYRAELQRLRDFDIIWNLIAPFAPGTALFVIGFLIPQIGIVKAVGLTAVFIASPSAVTIPLIRRKRRKLESEIRSLDALMQ